MHHETIITHKTLGLQDRIPEAPRLLLVHPDHGRPVNHLVECHQLPRRTIQTLAVKHRNKQEIWSKMIFNSPLTTPHNKTELAKTHLIQLLEDQLNNRLQTQITILRPSKDRQHLLRLLLGHGQEPRPQSCRGDYSLPEH